MRDNWLFGIGTALVVAGVVLFVMIALQTSPFVTSVPNRIGTVADPFYEQAHRQLRSRTLMFLVLPIAGVVLQFVAFVRLKSRSCADA